LGKLVKKKRKKKSKFAKNNSIVLLLFSNLCHFEVGQCKDIIGFQTNLFLFHFHSLMTHISLI